MQYNVIMSEEIIKKARHENGIAWAQIIAAGAVVLAVVFMVLYFQERGQYRADINSYKKQVKELNQRLDDAKKASRAAETYDNAKEKAKAAYESAKAKAQDALNAVSDKIPQEMKDDFSNVVNSASEKVKSFDSAEAYSSAKDSLTNLVDKIQALGK